MNIAIIEKLALEAVQMIEQRTAPVWSVGERMFILSTIKWKLTAAYHHGLDERPR